jgi:hypothetical protein
MLAALLALFSVLDLTLAASLIGAALSLETDRAMGLFGVFMMGGLVCTTAALSQAAALVGWLCGGAAALFGRAVLRASSARLGAWAWSGARNGLAAGFVLGPALSWGAFAAIFGPGPDARGIAPWIGAAVATSVGAPVLAAILGAYLGSRSGRWRAAAAGAAVGSLVGLYVAPAFFMVALTKSNTLTPEDARRPTFLRYSADQTRMATPLRDGRVVVWDADSGGMIWEEAVDQQDRLRDLVFSPDGRLLAGIRYDGVVRVWDARDGALLATLSERGEWAGGLAFSPDGGRLAAAWRDGSLQVWDVQTWREVRSRAIRPGPVWLAAFSPGGKRLATYGPDGMRVTTDFWD